MNTEAWIDAGWDPTDALVLVSCIKSIKRWHLHVHMHL